MLLSITGKPYDTLDSIIGFNDNQSSLKSFGIRYDQIDLKNNCFDYEAISKYLKLNKVKSIYKIYQNQTHYIVIFITL